MEYRRLTRDIGFSGKGLHTGEHCRVTLSPGVPGEGVTVDRGGEAFPLVGCTFSAQDGGPRSSFPVASPSRRRSTSLPPSTASASGPSGFRRKDRRFPPWTAVPPPSRRPFWQARGRCRKGRNSRNPLPFPALLPLKIRGGTPWCLPFLPVDCPYPTLSPTGELPSEPRRPTSVFPRGASSPFSLLPAPSPWRRKYRPFSTGGLRKEEALKTPWWWEKHPFPPAEGFGSPTSLSATRFSTSWVTSIFSAGLSGPGWSP